MGPALALGELGLVDPVQVDAFIDRALLGTREQDWNKAWDILNLETWVRAHYNR